MSKLNPVYRLGIETGIDTGLRVDPTPPVIVATDLSSTAKLAITLAQTDLCPVLITTCEGLPLFCVRRILTAESANCLVESIERFDLSRFVRHDCVPAIPDVFYSHRVRFFKDQSHVRPDRDADGDHHLPTRGWQ